MTAEHESAVDEALSVFNSQGAQVRRLDGTRLEAARQELADLRSELADWRDGAKQAAGEVCGDEKHCTCVPALRAELKRLAPFAATCEAVPIGTTADLRRMCEEQSNALSGLVETIAGAPRGCCGDHYIHTVQFGEDELERLLVLAAAAREALRG